MSNELTALPEFTRTLFKHAYIILPWFVRQFEGFKYEVEDYSEVVEYFKALKADSPRFFGDSDELAKANRKLAKFYSAAKPGAGSKANAGALKYYCRAWHHAWKDRGRFELRGHEVRLMKFFHEIFGKGESKHLAELIGMARLIDMDMVRLARLIVVPDGWTAGGAVMEAKRTLGKLREKLFGSEDVTAQAAQAAGKKRPGTYKKYQQAYRSYKEAARLRIIEIFDENGWHPIIDSATLHNTLKAEGLQEFLPFTYRGRVGVQPAGYPLTFYTYAGQELEQPPLNEVEMNMGYAKEEQGKDYQIHPVSDGTFYCQTSAMIGNSKCKYYTLEYKRRARRMKYDKINELAGVIEQVRERMLEHIHSDDRDTWVRALMCLFMDSKCARIGNATSAKAKAEKKTFGVTTLLTKKHVRVKGDQIIISYHGKHAQKQRHVFTIYRTDIDKRKHLRASVMADRLLELIGEGRKYLFTRSDGKPFTPQQVNEYFTAAPADDAAGLAEGGAGAPCTVHNLRNFHATRIFKEFAEAFGKKRRRADYEAALAAYQGRGARAKHRKVTGILEVVADKLGNTPAICRKAYIDPREQLLFFRSLGYRPPDCVIRDLFVHEESDPYGLERELKSSQRAGKSVSGKKASAGKGQKSGGRKTKKRQRRSVSA